MLMGSSQSNKSCNVNLEHQKLASDWENVGCDYWVLKNIDNFYFKVVEEDNVNSAYHAYGKASYHYREVGKIYEAEQCLLRCMEALTYSSDTKLIKRCAVESEMFGVRFMNKKNDTYAYRMLTQAVVCYIAIGDLAEAQKLLKTVHVVLSRIDKKKFADEIERYWSIEQNYIERLINACITHNVDEFTNVCSSNEKIVNSSLSRSNLMALCKKSYNL